MARDTFWGAARINFWVTFISYILPELIFVVDVINVSNYADDNKRYVAADNVDGVTTS